MPSLEYPKSDERRLEFLKTCIVMADGDKERGKEYLPEPLLAEARETLFGFSAASEKREAGLSARNKEIREKNLSMDGLERSVRDFFEVVKRRTYRNNDPAEVLRFYNISLSGDLPVLDSEEDILAAATKIVSGDSKAVEAGFTAMQNPSATEVEEKLRSARKERDETGLADRDYNQVQKDLQEARIPVDGLIREIADHLQFALRKETASNARRIMRTYGFNYRMYKGEPQEEQFETPVDEN